MLRVARKALSIFVLTVLVSGIISLSCSPYPTPTSSVSLAKTPNPPIVVTLDKIGVINDHDPIVLGAGEIYVYLGISDGMNQQAIVRIPSSGYISLNNKQTTDINQQVFSCNSVGDEVKFVAIAFESDADQYQVKSTTTSVFNALAPYLQGDVGAAAMLINILLNSKPAADDGCPEGVTPETPSDDFVGALERTYSSSENWGIGTYSDVTSGDLRLWFTISTLGATGINPQTSAVIPTQMPPSAPTTNPSPPIILPPPPTVTPKSLTISFDGWYADGTVVTSVAKGKPVVARLALSGGYSGQYSIRIRRAVSSAADQTVAEQSFSYNGISASPQLSFVPPYATTEASTQGYHVDLSRDGAIVWSLGNTYPPRLKVSKQ